MWRPKELLPKKIWSHIDIIAILIRMLNVVRRKLNVVKINERINIPTNRAFLIHLQPTKDAIGMKLVLAA